jgi:hypothetical protein
VTALFGGVDAGLLAATGAAVRGALIAVIRES